MKETNFKWKRKPVYVEHYTSNRDFLDTQRGRTPLFPKSYDTYTSDYFTDKTIDMGMNPWNGGYRDNHQLIESWLNSKVDTKIANDINRFSAECVKTNKVKLTRRVYRVAGGAVAMGRFMSGEPQCMVAVVRQQVKSKVLDLAVDVAVSCNVSEDTVRALGQVLAGAIAQLDSMGFNMRVHAIMGESMNTAFLVSDILIKDVSERFNANKLLYTLSDAGYTRGIRFGWIVRHPHYDDTEALGHPLYWDVQGKDRDEFYKMATGLDLVLNTQELAKEYEAMRGASDSERIEKMRDRIVKLFTE